MNKVEISRYKKSINESGFSNEHIRIIWDFYVTKSISESSAQKRKVRDFGITKLPYNEMLNLAGIEEKDVVALLADKMINILKDKDLLINNENNKIDIDKPRLAFLIPYQIIDFEKPVARGNKGKAEILLAHIRNALAHGNTYFFDNGNVLLEDKKSNHNITAMLLFPKQALLKWISLIDGKKRFYNIDDIT